MPAVVQDKAASEETHEIAVASTGLNEIHRVDAPAVSIPLPQNAPILGTSTIATEVVAAAVAGPVGAIALGGTMSAAPAHEHAANTSAAASDSASPGAGAPGVPQPPAMDASPNTVMEGSGTKFKKR